MYFCSWNLTLPIKTEIEPIYIGCFDSYLLLKIITTFLFMRILFILAFFICTLTNQAQTSIFSTGSSWKYDDNGIDLGTTWSSVTYNDASWPSGNAILGYGTINAGTINTTLGYGGNSSNKYPTYYFRKTFNYSTTGNETYYKVTALIDDGAIFYLNGVEVYRVNMPSGTVSYSTYAPAVGDESNYFTFNIPNTAIQNGSNIFAVEVHQHSASSSDIGLDVGLEAHFTIDISSIHFGSKDNPLNSLFITWRDNTGVDSIKWGYSSSYSQGKFKAESRALYDGDSLYEYGFPNLTPTSTLHYSIYSATYGIWSQDMTFETSSDPAGNSFRFVTLGDSRTNQNDWQTISSMVPACDFVLFSGDIVSNGSVTSDWDKWFEYGNDFISSHLVYHSLGNHEAQSGGYVNDTNYFVLPESATGKELYYSFTMGNAIIISLNSEDPGDVTQYNWLVSTLAANQDKTWKIIFFHKPFYTSPTHTTDMHGYFNTWWKAFDDYGVDIIINGHTHNYQRTKPINRNISTTSAVSHYGSCPNSGRCQIVSGRAGAPGYGVGTGWFIAQSTGDINYVMVDINGNDCKIVAKNNLSAVIDSFNITKGFDLSMSSTPEGPVGASNGTATVSPSGGISPYTFLWDNSATTATINNLDSGWYSVSVKDSNLCEEIDSVHVDTTHAALYVITESATNVQINTATLNADINPPSGGFIFGLQFEYGLTSSSYGAPINANPSYATGNISTTLNISGLSAGTTYHYRIIGTDGTTSYYGSDSTFTTLSPSVPTVECGSDFFNVTGTSAKNTANEVTSDGGSPILERGLVYGTSATPDITDNKETSSGTTGVYDITLLGLNYGTTYYARAYATNSVGTSYSTDEKIFTTEPQIQAKIDSVVRDINDPTFATVYFTYGNGDGFMLIIKESSDVDQFPDDNTSPDDYPYDANYGAGYHLGNGNYVAYNGTHSKGDITVGSLDLTKDYYFAALEYSGSGTHANYRTSDAATIGTDEASMPILLIDFRAEIINSTVNLLWTTASELNNREFEIQKSVNGKDFITFAKVLGSGNSNTILNYSMVDREPYNGISYYRLKQVDFDGKFSLSKIVTVNIDIDKTFNISNVIVSKNQISYVFNTSSIHKISMELIDVTGKVLYSKEVTGMQNSEIRVPMKDFSQGVYFIRLISQEKMLIHKVVY